jgi:hypothetical protein
MCVAHLVQQEDWVFIFIWLWSKLMDVMCVEISGFQFMSLSFILHDKSLKNLCRTR